VIALIQRVAEASVRAGGETAGRIERGVLAFLAVERGDGEAQAARLAERVLGYRIFPDAAGKMNLSLADIGGGLLVVPQFTLAADTGKGARPSFSGADVRPLPRTSTDQVRMIARTRLVRKAAPSHAGRLPRASAE